ncbi:uncharacterized protein LOC141658462 [Silene latifolia]|uniref:uncharacterized protein LOC141658462 n=1 Tax=Silene latifolia TaxID=37657 RepID=UPI003D76D23D
MDEKTREMLKNLRCPPTKIIDSPPNEGNSPNSTAECDPRVNSYITHEQAGCDLEELKKTFWQESARVALQHYYEKQGIKLELFGEVSTGPIFIKGFSCFHLDFQAKPEDDGGFSPKKMFAEVFWSNKREAKVTFCGIMDPSDPELLKGCRHCGKKVLHPPGMKFFKPAKAFGLGASHG